MADRGAGAVDAVEAGAAVDSAAAADGSDETARTTSTVALVVGATGPLLGLRRRPS